MAKPLIVKRNTKGSALTFTELDANFQNLDDATFTLKAGTGGTDVVSDLNGTITLVATDGISITGNNTAKTVSLDASVVQDTTPQLGGDLDVNGYDINSKSNGDVEIAPNGTGKIKLTTSSVVLSTGNITTTGTSGIPITMTVTDFTWGTSTATISEDITLDTDTNGKVIIASNTTRVGNLNTDHTITTYGTGDLRLDTNGGANSGYININDGVNGNITLAPNGTGDVYLNSDTVYVGDSGSTVNIFSQGVADLVLATNSGSNTGAITLSGANLPITITPNGSGNIVLNTNASLDGYVRVGDGTNPGVVSANGAKDLILLADPDNVVSQAALSLSASTGDVTFGPGVGGSTRNTSTKTYFGTGAAATTLTSNGAYNLTINTNDGTTTGSITLATGTNGNMTLACNGTGVILATSPVLGSITSSTNTPAIFARHTVTASASDTNPSINIQKARSDIAFAAMTDEPSVINFQVRDNTSTNRTFFRMIGRYAGTATNPSFTLRGSPDGFTTNLHYMTLGGGVGTFGNASSNYTLTSNTGGALILTANQNTTSGTITVASGTNANISLTPNGTGRTAITNGTITNPLILASYTAAALTALTGSVGAMAAVTNSAGGAHPNGMLAFWDTTNARWSYVHDNSAV